MASIPRLLTSADLPACFALSREAGWNQTERDWARLLRLAPQGCFGIDIDGQVAATATLLPFRCSALGWIGMVLTAPAQRRRGHATALVRHALAAADSSGLRCLKLDATGEGAPLYSKLGFTRERAVERWSRAGNGYGQVLSRSAFAAANGFYSGRLLRELARESRVWRTCKGYAMVRAGARAVYFGPCVCTDARTAGLFASLCVEEHAGDMIYWDLFPENQTACELARSLGFAPDRELVRMYRGEQYPCDAARVFAIAGFEYG